MRRKFNFSMKIDYFFSLLNEIKFKIKFRASSNSCLVRARIFQQWSGTWVKFVLNKLDCFFSLSIREETESAYNGQMLPKYTLALDLSSRINHNATKT